MKTTLQLLDKIEIASPCPVSWAQMSGNDQVRHCAQCDQKVYDLSTMTAGESLALLADSDGNVCVRLYRRKDGKIMTKDCVAYMLLMHLRRASLRFGVTMASFFGFAFALLGCYEQRAVQGKMCVPEMVEKQNADKGPEPAEK